MKKFSPQSSLSFQQLILGAAGLVGFRWRSFVIGAISFALVAAVAATFVDTKIYNIENFMATSVGLSRDDLQKKISADIGSMTESEMYVYLQHLQKEGFTSVPVTKDNLVVQYIIRTGPFVFGLMLFDLSVLLVCFTFFLFFFGNPIDSAYETSQKLPLAILRMTGLTLWMFLRSWVWIPFLGPLFALYFGPRLALAPAILASGEASVLQSAKLSLARTQCRWLAVFLQLVGFFLLAVCSLWLTIVVAGSVGLFFLKAGFFLWLFGLMATIGFTAALFVVLGASYR